jgi:hypothetical protein
MSVMLTALNEDPDFGGHRTVNPANGEWLAITNMACIFGILRKPWDGDHGSNTIYTPKELEDMAMRLESLQCYVAALRELAAAGGAELS